VDRHSILNVHVCPNVERHSLIGSNLVGARGTPQHAVLLGLVTTITHTLTIFLLGLGALFASHYVIPEQLYPILSVASGLTVCGVGVRLLQRRLHSEADHCSHHHHHEAGSGSHYHEPSSDASSDTSMASLMSLGIAGGMVPCPSALVLLLSAIALHQTAYRLFLISSFSAGMASVLVAVGLLVLYAKQWLDQFAAPERLGQQLSIVSAVVIVCAGIGLTVFSMV
jgi:nickel/cobalt exporter